MDNDILKLLQNERNVNFEIENMGDSLLVKAKKKIILPEEKKIIIDFSNDDLARINIDNCHKTSSGIILSI